MMVDSCAPTEELRRCINQLGIPKANLRWDLLEEALTHISASPERNYERLEFFGDSVLRLAASEFLMERFPNGSSGDMTAVRSHLVSDQTLNQLAETLGLAAFLRLAPKVVDDPTARPRLLADTMEAIIAVLYISTGNSRLVHRWLDDHFEQRTQQLIKHPEVHNPKNALQELTQKEYRALPEYRTTEISTLHGDPERFRSEVWLGDRALGSGLGATRKAAEQAAALQGYRTLQAKEQEASPPSD